MSESPIRQLTPADIPALVALKDSAGWNQTTFDIRLLFLLEPAGMYGIDSEEGLAASAGFVTYGGELAWIGMVLTAPPARHQGFARRLFQRCLDELERRRVGWIGLDATAMGKPLYEAHGFTAAAVIERWRRDPPHAFEPAAVAPFVFDAELDRRAFGADRAPLLAALAQQHGVCLPGEGYVCTRPGTHATFFGPCVAREEAAADSLIRSCLAFHSREVVFWDVLHSNAGALRLAAALGFTPVRTLWRMWLRGAARAASPVRDDSLVFGTAGFEFG